MNWLPPVSTPLHHSLSPAGSRQPFTQFIIFAYTRGRPTHPAFETLKLFIFANLYSGLGCDRDYGSVWVFGLRGVRRGGLFCGRKEQRVKWRIVSISLLLLSKCGGGIGNYFGENLSAFAECQYIANVGQVQAPNRTRWIYWAAFDMTASRQQSKSRGSRVIETHVLVNLGNGISRNSRNYRNSENVDYICLIHNKYMSL